MLPLAGELNRIRIVVFIRRSEILLTPRTAQQEAHLAYNILFVLLRVLFGALERMCEILPKDPLDSIAVLSKEGGSGCIVRPIKPPDAA
jgi:hypothetical protein